MSPELIGVVATVILLVLIYFRMWVGLAMLFVGFWGVVAIIGWKPALVLAASVPYRNVGDYTFAAIPMFIMMGAVLFHTGIASDLFYAAYKWLGRFSGGLAIACALAGAILGVVTDSMVAVVTLGKVAIPEMKKYKNDETLACSSLLAGASLASLIPPSVGFILYALLTEQSVGKLFIGAIIPGIVLTAIVILTILIRTWLNPALAPKGPKVSIREKVISLKYVWPLMLIIVLVIAGIYVGAFTPTEAGSIGAVFSIIIALVSGRLTRKKLIDSILETAQTTAMIVLMVAGGFIFCSLMSVSNLSSSLGEFVVGLNLSPYGILSVIFIIYILLGMFFDIIAAMMVTIPIFFPVITAIGFDPVWFGIIIVIVMEMGVITPPIGMNAFILSGISNVPCEKIFRGIWQFVIAQLACVVILTIFPEIVLVLPGMM